MGFDSKVSLGTGSYFINNRMGLGRKVLAAYNTFKA